MAVNLSPVGGVAAQFFTNTGAVLTGGKLYTYSAGTTTPAATFTSSLGVTPQPNPIVLDAAGRVPNSGEIWLTQGIIYKFVLKDSNDVTIATYDNITGINDITAQDTPYSPNAQSLLDGNATTVAQALDLVSNESDGSSYVGYQSSLSSSVSTTVKQKLSQTVSVFDFMTAAQIAEVQAETLLTDMSAAFNAAAVALAETGGTINIPVGKYRIENQISIIYAEQSFEDWRNYLTPISLQGEGKASQLYWYGGNSTSIIKYEGVAGTGFTSKTFIRDFFIQNANASTGLRGITLGNETQPNQKGIVNATISGMFIGKCARAINVQYESHECMILDNHLYEYTDYGVWLKSNGCSISNNHIQAGAQGAIGIYAFAVGLTLSVNTIESSLGGSGFFLENTSAFTVTNSYCEQTTNLASPGSNYALKMLGCSNGYVGQNEFGGFPGGNIMYVGQDLTFGNLSRNIQFGVNNYASSGGDAAYVLYVEPASNNGIYITGRLQSSGATPETNQQWTSYLRQNGVRATFGGGSLDFINISGNSVSALFNCLDPAVYFVNVTQGTENLIASGIVSMAPGAAGPILFKTGSTDDAQLEIRVGTGPAVNIWNGIGAIRTIYYTVTRMA